MGRSESIVFRGRQSQGWEDKRPVIRHGFIRSRDAAMQSNDILDLSFDVPDDIELSFSNGRHAKLASRKTRLGLKLRELSGELPSPKGFVNDGFLIDDPIPDGTELDFEPEENGFRF